MRTERLVPYVDPLAREVSNPHRTLVGGMVEESPAEAVGELPHPKLLQREIAEDRDMTETPCNNCDDKGWVCEVHPDRPFKGVSDRADACECGPGMPCPICHPWREEDHPPAAVEYAKNWKPLREDRYEDAMTQYRELTQGVRMIREAVEQTFGAGLLSSGEYAGASPVEDCEAIARSIYAAGGKQPRQ
jgi:hypothetical protein